MSKIEDVTLKEFIDDNEKLLTTMGVMGALAALFTTIPNAEYLAFLSFFMVIVLDIEVVRVFYKIRKTRRWSATLIMFETALELLVVGILVFVIMTYPSYIGVLLAFPLGVLAGLYFYRRRRSKTKLSEPKTNSSIQEPSILETRFSNASIVWFVFKSKSNRNFNASLTSVSNFAAA
jgi:hypothetical protein